MITKQDSLNLLNRLEQGIQHKKEVKKCRSNHKCHGQPNCKVQTDNMIRIGEPAIIITNEITNPYTQRTIFTKPKYYHTSCILKDI